MGTFSLVIDLFAKLLVTWGSIYCVMGVVGLAQGFKDSAGGTMAGGIQNLVGGGGIALASVIVKSITLA